MDIYVDESGDLGFSLGSSRFFVVAYLMTGNSAPIVRVMKRFLGRSRTRKMYAGREFKFSNSNPEIRAQLLGKLLNVEWRAGLIIMEKGKVAEDLRGIPETLYNYTILESLMKDVLSHYDNVAPLNFYIDRSKDKARAEAFNKYALEKASYTWRKVLKNRARFSSENLRVEHCNSNSNKCIQVADFIAGAAFQKYERDDSFYLNIIGERVSKETYLWR